MNMREKNSESRLLIGLPYAEKYPKLFFNSNLFDDGSRDASSYGVVQSLTEFKSTLTGRKDVKSNGFPARSFFGIYHIIETPVGAFFNKKATQMELQPSPNGKLALVLPPIPFSYELVNGPIPLFDVKRPNDDPLAELTWAAHGADMPAPEPSMDEWPWHQPDLQRIDAELRSTGG